MGHTVFSRVQAVTPIVGIEDDDSIVGNPFPLKIGRGKP